MNANEKIVRELCSLAEGSSLNTEKFVSMFTDDGYMWDMAAGVKLRGKEIADALKGLSMGLPDVHREIHQVYVTENVVIVELSIQGTHTGDLPLPTGALKATGKKIDFPSCDVFYIKNGKIKSFHCYNEAAVMMRQIGV